MLRFYTNSVGAFLLSYIGAVFVLVGVGLAFSGQWVAAVILIIIGIGMYLLFHSLAEKASDIAAERKAAKRSGR